MSRSDLERLSKEELIELMLKLYRPAKTLAHLVQTAGERQHGAVREGPGRRATCPGQLNACRPSPQGLPAPWLEPAREGLVLEPSSIHDLEVVHIHIAILGGEARCPAVRLGDAADAVVAAVVGGQLAISLDEEPLLIGEERVAHPVPTAAGRDPWATRALSPSWAPSASCVLWASSVPSRTVLWRNV